MEDLGALCELAVSLAREAGDLLVEGARHRHAAVETKTSATDMVTELDRASEALIVRGIAAARPDDSILAEEGSGRSGTSGVEWVIDPLDGTTNYLYGHVAYAVSIAVEISGEPVVGVVANPPLGEVFTAVAGTGAHLNEEPIRISGCADLSTALVGTGFGYVAEQRERQAAMVSRVLPAVRDIRRNGAASLDLCWVACGRLDAYYEAGLQPWDMAAGALVAREAGATVCGFDGGPPSTESIVAACPSLSGPLLALLAARPGPPQNRHLAG